MSEHLAQLLSTNEEITWVADDPNKLRYLLLQAFTAAREHAAEGEPYASIALLPDRFKLRVMRGTVRAEPKRVAPLAAIRAQVQQKVVVKDVFETAEIIAALNLHKATEVVFEGARQEDLNLKGLYEVAKKHGYYMIPASTHVTFSKHSEDEDLAWTPAEEA